MKKSIALCLSLILCLSILGTAHAETITYPLSTDTELTYWVDMTNTLFAVMESYNEHIVWNKWQENTGVKLNFEHPAAGMAKEDFGLMLVSGELPDIIQEFGSYYTGGIQAGYEDGLVMDLTDLVKEYAPDYYKLISQNEDTWRQFTVNDRILSFNVWNEEENVSSKCILMRQDWLDEFGLKAEDMTTYDAYEKYFQAILDNKPGVVPLYLTVTPNNSSSSVNNTIYWGYNIQPDWCHIGDEVIYYDKGNLENYRAWMERMHAWYEKGYISQDFASYTYADSRAKFSAGTVGCYVVNVGPGVSDADASGIPIVKCPLWRVNADDAVNVCYYEGFERNGQHGTVITTACKDPITAVKLLNYGYTDEGMYLSNYGVEGVSYTVDESGKRVFTDTVYKNPTYGTTLTMYIYRIHYMPNRRLADVTSNPAITIRPEVVAMRKQYTEISDKLNGNYIMPTSVALTSEENAERSGIMQNADTYIAEMRLKFITGVVEINDATWSEYLTTLYDTYKLSRALEITQAAYNRYIGK